MRLQSSFSPHSHPARAGSAGPVTARKWGLGAQCYCSVLIFTESPVHQKRQSLLGHTCCTVFLCFIVLLHLLSASSSSYLLQSATLNTATCLQRWVKLPLCPQSGRLDWETGCQHLSWQSTHCNQLQTRYTKNPTWTFCWEHRVQHQAIACPQGALLHACDHNLPLWAPG